ncbi:alanine--tRNA ligase [Bacteriovoracales bacterium]|nr:alanine--tRNA ligase [Bacteriovoracales bacterium]
MQKLTSLEIRNRFIEFFQEKEHLKISGSSVVPKNDPTLLFINSGMAPLKKYFLAKEEPPHPRLVNFQPCIRTKDIDDVGDRHHLTIFEMLGSWSIGDYYKEKAVELAYELLVDRLGFDKNSLYVTVYEGSKELNLDPDNISAKAWERVGIDPSHIIHLGEDNFWGPAGETGPCGPCTEVFYDCGDDFGPAWKPGDEFDTTKRYIEIWNAGVFMELNKNADGTFSSLPLKSVDTGSGLERMAMIMNGLESVYETDLLKPLLDLCLKLYKLDMQTSRMLTDHLRAAAFIISEGVGPSNEGQGYIPRRLLRKCIAALVKGKIDKVDFSPVLEKTIEILSPIYPQLKSNSEFIFHQINTEISDFMPIVKKGLEKIDQSIKELKGDIFPGEVAFDLVTTFGLPLDVIKSELQSRNVSLHEEDYEKAYAKHRSVSRVVKSATGEGGASDEKIEEALKGIALTKFSGYEKMEDKGTILKTFHRGEEIEEVKNNEEFLFACDQTPFYAESGGQSGDKGHVTTSTGKAEVLDTMKFGKIHLHKAKVLTGSIKSNQEAELIVEKSLRVQTRNNHSATHLLHSALHAVVGKHALQKGSAVNHERLRFDFQNNSALTEEQIENIENLVNQWIRDNSGGEIEEVEYNEAIKSGALALFGENYEEKVRVVKFGKNSVELCGGTHVSSTGEIGLFVITAESSVAKGIRRIEAVTGAAAFNLIQKRSRILKKASMLLASKPEELVESISQLKKKSKEKKKSTEAVSSSDVQYLENRNLTLNNRAKFMMARLDKDRDSLKTLGDQIIDKGEQDILTLVGVEESSVRTFVWVKKELSKKVNASDLLKKILKPIEGKGGGKPFFAQGGGSNIQDVSKMFDLVENGELTKWFEERI